MNRKRDIFIRRIVVLPVMWPFIAALLLVIIGSLSDLKLLSAIGLFIIFIYALVFIVWIISEMTK